MSVCVFITLRIYIYLFHIIGIFIHTEFRKYVQNGKINSRFHFLRKTESLRRISFVERKWNERAMGFYPTQCAVTRSSNERLCKLARCVERRCMHLTRSSMNNKKCFVLLGSIVSRENTNFVMFIKSIFEQIFFQKSYNNRFSKLLY